MTGYPFAFMAGVLAVSLEYIYLRASSFASIFIYTAPFQIMLGYLLYRLIHVSSGTMEAFVLFSGTTLTLRLLTRLVSGQEISLQTWIAYGLIVSAQIVKHGWR